MTTSSNNIKIVLGSFLDETKKTAKDFNNIKMTSHKQQVFNSLPLNLVKK